MTDPDKQTEDDSQADDLERAAEQLERPLASLIGDYEEGEAHAQSRARGVFLLPNIITTGALFCGFYAVIAGMQNDFYAGSVAIFVAMVLDGLDGRIARLTNTTSAFGAEFDSMADMVSFGVAPALLVFNWALTDIGKAGWVAAFIFTACAALRLARFNTQLGKTDNRFFSGLASPAAAALIAGSVWIGQALEIDASAPTMAVLHAALLILLGFLMISSFPYYSFKSLNLEARVPFVRVLLFLALLGLVALNPPVAMWLLFFAYALSGPVQHLRRNVVKRSSEATTAPTSASSDNEADSNPQNGDVDSSEADEAKL